MHGPPALVNMQGEPCTVDPPLPRVANETVLYHEETLTDCTHNDNDNKGRRFFDRRSSFITMLLFSAHHRLGDQWVPQNHSETPLSPLPESPTPPGSSASINSFSTQIQCNSHIEETSSCTPPAPLRLKPAYLNDRKQEQRSESRSQPVSNRESLRDLDDSSSSHEPPDTDPGNIHILWNEVISQENTHGLPKSQLSIDSMETLASEEYDSQGFSSAAFSEVLKRYQITFQEDVVVPSDLVVSFWRRIREAVGAAPAETVPMLEGCKVWEDNDESSKTKATAKVLAAELKVLLTDRDSSMFNRQRFFTDQLLGSCPLPGVRVFNHVKMLDVATVPYHLISAKDSSTSSISTQPIGRKSTKLASLSRAAPPRAAPPRTVSQNKAQPTKTDPTTLRKPTNLSTRLSRAAPPRAAPPRAAPPRAVPPRAVPPLAVPSRAVPSRTVSQNKAQPTKTDPATLRKLSLPQDMVDCAYWLDASGFHSLSAKWIARQTFVSNGTTQKTSPYLSIAFENSECGSFIEKRLLVNNKIAVYGSTALYNRHLLYIKALKTGRNTRSSIGQVERRVSILHFGLVILDEEATLFVFRCDKDPRDQTTAWQGCNVFEVGEWNLTVPDELADMLYHLRIVADWVKKVYVPVLREDLIQLSNSLDH